MDTATIKGFYRRKSGFTSLGLFSLSVVLFTYFMYNYQLSLSQQLVKSKADSRDRVQRSDTQEGDPIHQFSVDDNTNTNRGSNLNNNEEASPPKLSEPCRKPYEKYLLSEWTGNQTCVPPPEGDTDLPRHHIDNPRFSCDRNLSDEPNLQLRNSKRYQLHITCTVDDETGDVITTGAQRLVDFGDDLQTFNTTEEKACLHQYIYQHCYDEHPVPDIIHLLWYSAGGLTSHFSHTIGLYSLFTVAKPCLVLFHGDVSPEGLLWENILPAATSLVRVWKSAQTEVNGTKIDHVQNQADIGRIEILLEYGGIYLDSDMVVTKKLDIFRDVQLAANKAGGVKNLANGIMIAVPGQDLLQEWLGIWDTYDGKDWGSHSVQMITKLAKKYPHRMQALGPIFIKFGIVDLKQMYGMECSLDPSYAAHFYRAGYPFFFHKEPPLHPTAVYPKKNFISLGEAMENENKLNRQLTYMKKVRSTFGRIARFVLFGDASPCRA